MNLGFLTVSHESNGYLGGYLVTNKWGRPLEFRLSSAVQPNHVQKVLYANTLKPYICSDLIGKTLIDKTAAPAELIITDNRHCLDLRNSLDIPVAWLAHAQRVEQNDDLLSPPPTEENHSDTLIVRDTLHCHSYFPQDVQTINDLLDGLIGMIDLSEPFSRVREAMGEARKMGVSKR